MMNVFNLNLGQREIIMRTETVKVSGMTCDGCTSKVAHSLKAVSGVHNVVVSLSTGEAAVRYDELLATPEQLRSAVKGAGYSVSPSNPTHSHQSKSGCCS